MKNLIKENTDKLLSENKNKEVGKSFMWRDQLNNYHAPSEMETRHLFFCLKMVWNHFMPEEAKLYPFKKYEFSSFYTKKYMKMAVVNLSEELFKRNDLEERFYNDIDKMMNYLSTHQLVDKNI